MPSPTDSALWTARKELEIIHDYALSKRVSPWSALGVVLARAIASVPPHVVLPDIIGTLASLNFFLGLVSDSGGGKSTSMGVGRDVMRLGPWDTCVAEHTIGSGQGIAHAYARKVKGVDEPVQHTECAILTTEEVDHFNQKNQSGSTLMPELRRFYMGEKLGHLYVDPVKRVQVPEHAYRGVLIVGIQPERAGVLLEEAPGGTPQRFVWLPADYPHPAERPAPVEPFTWNRPEVDSPPLSSAVLPPDAIVARKRIVFDVCQAAVDAIDAAALARSRGQGDLLDGHLLLCREKVAAGFGLLDGRLSITDEDWQLSGVVMELSNEVRAYTVGVLADQQRSARKARAVERVETEVAVEAAKERRRVVDGARKIAAKVWAEPDRWTRNALYRDMRRHREVFDDALGHAVAEGWIVEVDEPSHTDQHKRAMRPGKRQAR